MFKRSAGEIVSGKEFFNGGSSQGNGAWATQALLAARMRGEPMSANTLRTCDVLRHEEWEEISEELIAETKLRLNGMEDLISAGLTKNVANAFGKTVFKWEDVSDMEEAQISLDGTSRTPNQALDYGLNEIPLPMTFSDWDLTLRMMAASTERGESLETHQGRLAARKVVERMEKTLFQGGPNFGAPIPGYTTHVDRNTGSYSVAAWDQAGATGPVIKNDVLAMKQALIDDGFDGPWVIYIPLAFETKFDDDYEVTANRDQTIRDRILRISGISAIKFTDQMPTDEVVMVTMVPDTVVLLDGMGVTAVQWDVQAMKVSFKIFAIQTPLIRSTKAGDSGVFHLS